MNTNSFSWKTDFKSIIVVDDELFHNTYNVEIFIRPTVKDLKSQSEYFEKLKLLYNYVFANTIISHRDDPLFEVLQDYTSNRFVELPKPPYDQIMAAVCFTKSNAILDGQILVERLNLSSYQGDHITYSVNSDSPELRLLDVDNWFSTKYNKFDPWWLRPDTATYDEELEKGIYTGHLSWNLPERKESQKTENHAKIFEFNPKVLDGGKDKKK